jgi:hypothetical protein
VEAGPVTLDGTWIKCDVYGCDTAILFDVRTIAHSAKHPDQIRRWFAMNGWNSKVGEGGSEGLVDACPLH